MALATKRLNLPSTWLCIPSSLLQNSYLGYNNPGATEADIEAYVRQVVYGLFSVLATMGTVPVIRCAGGGPAEMVARQLNELVSEHLLGGSTPFFSRGTAASFHRPLLVLFDRNDDLITSLHHTSTYQVRACGWVGVECVLNVCVC